MCDTRDFVVGMLIGGMVGAAAALLLAPMAGPELRGEIKEKTGEWVETGRKKAGELIESGKKIAVEKGQEVSQALRRKHDTAETGEATS